VELQTIWYWIIWIFFTIYFVLDGFDLGVSGLFLFFKEEPYKKILVKSIGPFWDGNEVWLIAGGAALFAAFPVIYGALISGFYILIIILLFCFIARAVSLEFYFKTDHSLTKKFFNLSIPISGISIVFIFGLILGNLINGIELNLKQEINMPLAEFFNPYAILMGVSGVLWALTHGSMYLLIKLEGVIYEKTRILGKKILVVFALILVSLIVSTQLSFPVITEKYNQFPILYLLFILTGLAILLVYKSLKKQRSGLCFFGSISIITILFAIVAFSFYPNFIFSSEDSQRNLTIFNSSSSSKSLAVLTNLSLIGLPLVIGGIILMYRTFHGKINENFDDY
jgi:cytochrome d ubiquinol oxidase subunit II